MKVTIVGSGFVGQTTAMRILEKRLAEVCLIDIIEGKPQGLALDLKQAAPIEGYEPSIVGTNDYADTAGSDIVVITAGFPRQPGMSRMDLLGKNAAIMRDVVGNVVPGSPGAILVVVSNPLDEMTFLAAEASALPRERVMGMAGVLDSARLRFFIADELGVSPNAVEAMTLGSHGDAMVALPRHATVNGTRLPELVDESTLERLFQRTRDGGAEIVGLLKSGSAYYAPSASVVAMVRAIVEDTDDVLPVCAWTTGQYGISGCLRRGAGASRCQRCGGDRRARPERRRAGEASRGCRRHPREVRGPRAPLGSDCEGFLAPASPREVDRGSDDDERSPCDREPDTARVRAHGEVRVRAHEPDRLLFRQSARVRHHASHLLGGEVLRAESDRHGQRDEHHTGDQETDRARTLPVR